MNTCFNRTAIPVLVCAIVLFSSCSIASEPRQEEAEHPRLVMTKAGVAGIREELGSVPLFDTSLARVRAEVDAEIALGIDTPIPKDYSGGYTHERHKRNFFVAQQAGALFQILGEQKYADYVRDMLFAYEGMYDSLPLHPKTRSYARGKLFWQCLNDANWLVYMSQAYDAIYETLSVDERDELETNLFRPFADHISIDSPQFFNRVHNHSTWGAAAVGMIGLVMNDDELVQRALYGIQDDGVQAGTRDDDGGFIKVDGQSAGFLANLESPFSPDGYYTEGPYYQRYAMYPFLIFAQGLHNSKPELEIFKHKDGVLLKAVHALLQLTDADGEFFPLNDAQKGMSYHSRELISAVDIAFHVGGHDPSLLSVAEAQGQVLLDDAGFSVALAVREGKTVPFIKRSTNLSDGSDGTEGGVAILRHPDAPLELVFKYAAQGLSHGHYDKLSMSVYEQGDEVLQDYGMSRFVNVEQKGGGNYLPENTTWAKQTIAHNTIVQDETSHFQGKYEIGSEHHSELFFYADNERNVRVASALETNAYPGTRLHRTVALIREDRLDRPFVLDVFRVRSTGTHQYDLPFYYSGQLLSANFDYEVPDALRPLGNSNGYQHLFLEATGTPASSITTLTWMHVDRFYTLNTVADSADALLFSRLGANDPDFNLRRDPAFIIRREAADTVFVSTIESHGNYSPVTELAMNSRSSIADLRVARDDSEYTVVSIESVTGEASLFFQSNANANTSAEHEIMVADRLYRWTGPYHYTTM